MLGRAGHYFQKRVHRLAGDDTLEAAKSFAGKLRSHINFVSYTKLVIDIELWERSLPAKRPSRPPKISALNGTAAHQNCAACASAANAVRYAAGLPPQCRSSNAG